MCISDFNPTLYERIRNLGEERREYLFQSHEVTCQCIKGPYPFYSDLAQACSCHDCLPKIQKLLKFQTDILFITDIIQARLSDADLKEWKCWYIGDAANSTKTLYRLLHLNHKQLCEESGITSTLEKGSSIEDTDQRINRVLVNAYLNDDNQEWVQRSGVAKEIDIAHFNYGRTRVKHKACAILNQTLHVEHLCEADDFLDSKILHIEEQIKMVEALPMEELEIELEEVMKEIYLLPKHRMMFRNVRNCISYTCAAMYKERMDFWINYKKINVNEHGSNKLDKTLVSLLKKVDLFEEKWEKEFSHFYNRMF